MTIRTERLMIRDFTCKDAEALYRIAREKNMLRFMADWTDGTEQPQDYYKFIDCMRRRKHSKDMRTNKRYAVALLETDEVIGMVGMGLEDTLNEVEVAYFTAEAHQRQGYAKEAVKALVDWIFKVSNAPYLIATVDCANEASHKTALACGFELFEKRTPIGHRQPNMESDSYYYFRRCRPGKDERGNR